MAKDKYLTIPCKCYVKKYIETRYGSPVRVNNNTLIGIFIYAMLEKKYYDNRNHDFGNSFIHQHYNDSLGMVVSDFVFFNIGSSISPDRALAINRLLEELLEEHLYLWCEAFVRDGKQRKEAIEEFAEQYNIDIEIDISYESLKKSEYRLRKKKESLLKKDEHDLFR